MTVATAPEIVLAQGEEANGLANMLSELIKQNVEQNQSKLHDFMQMQGVVSIEVPDAEEAITLDFGRGRLVVSNGVVGRPMVRIRANSDLVMGLSLMPIGPLGLPNYLSSAGRDVVRSLMTGGLRINGMHHLDLMNRLTRIFSVV
ncbi:MAG: hypothetical protein ACYDAY_09150 [Candidatus Dormibacteria bacterium]